MKKILFLLGLIICSFATFAQSPTWTVVKGHYEFQFFKVDSVVIIPNYHTVGRPSANPAGQIIYNIDSVKCQYSDGSNWNTFGGPAGGGGTLITNVGGGYRFGVVGTANLKTFIVSYGLGLDSITSNVINLTLDTNKMIPYTDTLKANGMASKSYVVAHSVIETDPIATAKTITDSASTGIILIGTNTQTIGSNPIFKFKADTSLLVTITMLGTKVNKSDTAAMLTPYMHKSDTAAMLSPYARSNVVVKYTDTASMLTTYLRSILGVKYTDTAAMLSTYARSNTVVKYTDTAAMLSPYTRSNAVVKYSDTGLMLTPYLRKIDTTAMLSTYARSIAVVKYTDTATMLSPYSRSNLIVKYTDTATMFTNYLRKGDTSAMLTPYLRKTDTAAMLTPYSRSNLIVKYTDTSTMLAPYLRKFDTTAMLSPYLRANVAAATYYNVSNPNSYIARTGISALAGSYATYNSATGAIGTDTSAGKLATKTDLLLYGLKSTGLNQFAATTSAQLAGVVSDELGVGKLFFIGAPPHDGMKIGSVAGVPTWQDTTAGGGGSSTPDTVHLSPYGTGIRILSTNNAGAILFHKTVENSVTVTWSVANDSAIQATIALNFQNSLIQSGANINLVNDVNSPGNSFFYGTNTSGSKGWFSYTSIPVATLSNPGLMSAGEKARLDSNIKVLSQPGVVGDTIVHASALLDSLIFARFSFITGQGMIISKTGSSLGFNQYTISAADNNILGIVADSVTDDSAVVATRVAVGGAIQFPYNKIVYLSGPIALPNNHTSINFNGSRIKINSSNANFSKGIFYTPNTTAVYTDNSPTASMIKGQNWIKYSLAASISVGQIVQITGSIYFSPYKYGCLGIVKSIHVDTLFLNVAADTTFTVASINAYTRINAVSITNGTLDANGNTNAVGINLFGTSGSEVKRVTVHGAGCQVGIEMLSSFDGLLAYNRVDSVINVTNSLGYGLSMNGTNITAEYNEIDNCKHDLTAGSANFMSTGILYYRNILGTHNQQTALGGGINIDMHGNVHGDITENKIVTQLPTAIQVRSWGINVLKNKIYIDNTIANTTNVKAIDFLEAFRGECIVDGNEITIKPGSGTNIVAAQFEGSYATAINVTTQNNISHEGLWVLSQNIDNFKFLNNYLDADTLMFSGLNTVPRLNNFLISGNTIFNRLVSGGSPYGIIIQDTINAVGDISLNIFHQWKTTTVLTKFATNCTGVKCHNNTYYTSAPPTVSSSGIINDLNLGENPQYDNFAIDSNGNKLLIYYTSQPPATRYSEGLSLPYQLPTLNINIPLTAYQSGAGNWDWNISKTYAATITPGTNAASATFVKGISSWVGSTWHENVTFTATATTANSPVTVQVSSLNSNTSTGVVGYAVFNNGVTPVLVSYTSGSGVVSITFTPPNTSTTTVSMIIDYDKKY